MKLLDRYILRELFKLFLAVLMVVSVAFIIQRMIFLTEWSMHRGVGMIGVIKMLGCLFPGLFLTAIPLVSLFVIIVVLSQLSEDNELVIMMCAGRDLKALARPVMLFSLFAAALTAYLAFYLTPQSIRWFEIVRWELVQSKSEKALPVQSFVEFGKHSQIYIQKKDEEGLKNLIVFQQGESDWPFGGGPESQNFIFARRARIHNRGLLTESLLMLEDGIFISHQRRPDQDQFVDFNQAVARIDFEGAEKLKKRLSRQAQSAELASLMKMIRQPDDSRDRTKSRSGLGQRDQARIELAQRASLTLACLLLALWGIGLGIKPPRTGRTVSYILGAASGFGYYYLNVAFKALALKKMMSIELALLFPSILIVLSGAWLIQQRLAGKEPLNFLYQLDENLRRKFAEKKPK